MTGPRISSLFALSLPVLVFSAFLTEIKFIPALANNIGVFEIVGALVTTSFLLTTAPSTLVGHRVLWLVGSATIVAAASLIGVRGELVPAEDGRVGDEDLVE